MYARFACGAPVRARPPPVMLKVCNEVYFGELPVVRTATSE
jgi:hypothetical protein